MRKHAKIIAHGALLAAMYAVLTHFQNLLIPGSASWAIQLRLSEALCVLSFFTPAAIPGLTVGCLVFNLTFAAALPLDPIVGSIATLLTCSGMYLSRKWCIKGVPLPGLLLPALINGLLVGWELSVYIGGGFWLNGVYVALGEAIVVLTLGTLLYTTLKSRGLARRLFGDSAC